MARGGQELKRNALSPVWGHKNPELDKQHQADEHEVGAGGWRCHECAGPVVIVSSKMQFLPIDNSK